VEEREVTFDSTLSEQPAGRSLGFSIATADAPVCVSRRLQPVALLASLGPGLNAANDGTAIRFVFTGSGIKLLTDGAFSSDTFSDEGGSGARGMHLSLRPGVLAAGRRPLLTTTAWRYSFYNPEMNLLAESELTTTAGTPPAILYEYVWFNGHPVAQVDTPVASPVTHWTFTDHLGTPLIQTDSGGNTYWQAEYEPFGKVFTLRTGDQHQPLRLPGQEAEKLEPLNPGPNGATERSYNIFRWYRNGWGRYTQEDPLGIASGPNVYSYVGGNPITSSDSRGLSAAPQPAPVPVGAPPRPVLVPPPAPESCPVPRIMPAPPWWLRWGLVLALWNNTADAPGLGPAEAGNLLPFRPKPECTPCATPTPTPDPCSGRFEASLRFIQQNVFPDSAAFESYQLAREMLRRCRRGESVSFPGELRGLPPLPR
jgi:RHS repeat-associated protein